MIFLFILLNSFNLVDTESANTEYLTFSVLQNKKVIGEVKASKTTSRDAVTYKSHTKSTARVIISITIESTYEVYMEKGEVRYTEANLTVRGRPYVHSYTQYCEGQCQIVKDGINVINIDRGIHYSSTMVLFEEPIGVNSSYSELDGSFHPIKKIGDHAYEKTDVKGKKNRYYYEDGELTKADIDAGLIRFSIVK